jgi:DNA segregation ATPase FtsK/SpoIIIE-like protein
LAVYTNISKNNNKKAKRPTRTFPGKNLGFALMGLTGIFTIALFTNFLSFLRFFLLGSFGVFSFAITSSLFIVARGLIAGKKYNINKKHTLVLVVALISLLSIFQLAFLGTNLTGSYGTYLADVYNHQSSVGGLIIALITFPLLKILNPVGAYVFFIILLAIMSAFIVDYLSSTKTFKKITSRTLVNYNDMPNRQEENLNNIKEKEVKRLKNKEPVNLTLNAQQDRQEQARESAREKLGLVEGINNRFVTEEVEEPASSRATSNYKPIFESSTNTREPSVKRPPRILHNDYNSSNIASSINKSQKGAKDKQRNLDFLRATIPGRPAEDRPIRGTGVKNPNAEYSTTALNNRINRRMTMNEQKVTAPNVDKKFEADLKAIENNDNKNKTSFNIDPIIPSGERTNRFNARRVFEDETIKSFKPEKKTSERKPKNVISGFEQMELEGTKVKKQKVKKSKFKKPSRYVRPSIDLLHTISTNQEDFSEEYIEKSKRLEQVLNDFRVPAKVIAVTKGPAVTRYELQMPAGVSVKKITQHAEDIAMTLASNGAVRIEAPIPGKNAVGVEVPNNKIATIGLKDVMDSREFTKSKSPLTFALGKDISGAVKICDLAKMPHLLVAGATGSGKSVCLNSLIISMLYKSSPEDLRLILIDPKQVEFYAYNGLPHLMLPKVITEPAKALNALNWAINEMERRFETFQRDRVKNLTEYNEQDEVINGKKPKYPMIVIIVDELADLIMQSKRDVEEKIMRLAQKARAAGIHLVLATQRPSVDVITGTIKANLPSRIAFSVTSFADSKTILDGAGAEKLLGKGDMLYAPLDYPEPRRIQGAFVSNDEVKNIVDFIKRNNEAYFDENAEDAINNKPAGPIGSNGKESDFDAILPEALKLIIQTGQASISMIQRRFSVGYPRASRIIDQMEMAKFVSPSDGSKARKVYLTMEEYNKMF